ncbi:OmpA family protein [Halomonas halocynthiae]|uniref:OmpA family protein n=1 Tax=Halomonas halocynthiae TaxID=176290 RepID=UPI0003F4E8C4|nr:OmpA family protein [Halomonas halocynthiae]
MGHKQMLLATVVAATAALLQGCVSSGSTNESGIMFPDMDSAYLKEGTFVAPDAVLRVSKGQNKDQIRALLDIPQFSEGLFGVREWNYAFNFYTDSVPKGYVTCQYQVHFDDDVLVESTHWKNEMCADLLVPVEAAPVPESTEERVRLSADVLFDFDSDVLRFEGQRSLERVADLLVTDFNDPEVRVLGHTDRIGNDAYNQRLSDKRANAVRQVLIAQGINPLHIQALGMGESNPVVSCAGESGAQLKECLQPNRRVDILINGERQVSAN